MNPIEKLHGALLDDVRLEQSAVVANNRMNRERVLQGVNSYEKELGIDLIGHLKRQAALQESVRWIDICCGAGNALLQAVELLHSEPYWPKMHLEGLDLVGIFPQVPATARGQLHFQAGSVNEWQPSERYDLITCIHGVHYLGDKLGFIRRALAQLAPGGWLVFNFDSNNFRDQDGRPMQAWWQAQCKQMGWRHDRRRHLLHIVGGQDWPQTWEYLGASDEAGPNYSGQSAVNSFYRI